jgi:hypothetical protein
MGERRILREIHRPLIEYGNLSSRSGVDKKTKKKGAG